MVLRRMYSATLCHATARLAGMPAAGQTGEACVMLASATSVAAGRGGHPAAPMRGGGGEMWGRGGVERYPCALGVIPGRPAGVGSRADVALSISWLGCPPLTEPRSRAESIR